MSGKSMGENTISLTPNARLVLGKRYLKKDSAGNPIETPEDMFRRIAKNVASADSIYDKKENIFETVKQAAIIHKSGGGTGFSFSRIRPKNDCVSTSGGFASGPLSFIKVFNEATEAINQGGFRRGANMAVLRVDHPDILGFIHSKQFEGILTNFNISIGITNAFMQAVEKNQPFPLINPRTRAVVKTINAKQLFDQIIHSA